MKKCKNFKITAILGIFLSITCFGTSKTSQIKALAEGIDNDGYYKEITAVKGQDLLGQLHDLVCKTHTTYRSYDDCKDPNIVYKTDRGSTDQKITEFYTQSDVSKPWGANRVGTWNREHVWCQSLSIDIDTGDQLWGTKGGGSDLHHVRPVEYTLNSARNNTPYGEFESNRQLYAKYKKDESGTYDKLGGYLNAAIEIFEPIDEVKGDVARILFYDYTHYSDYKICGGTSNYTTDKNIKFGHLLISNIITTSENTEESAWKLLLKWNKMDPVSQAEEERNEAAYLLQGNRNPFIDNQLYADAIWGDQLVPKNLIEDTIDPSKFTNKTNGYKLYEGVSCGNSAKYAIYADVKENEICLKQNCALMSTISGGYVRAISANPSENNPQGTILKVYGSDNAYVANDYANSQKYGTFVGEIDFSKFENALEIRQNFKYILLVSNNNTCLKNIKIYWGGRVMSGLTNYSNTKANLAFNYDFFTTVAPRFVRVKENLDDFTGKYLIVADFNDYCLNGSLPTSTIDSDFDGHPTDIIEDTINPSDDMMMCSFDVQKMADGVNYSIKSSKNGYYIGHRLSGYSLDTSSSEIANSITIDKDGFANIKSTDDYHLAYNTSSNRLRFRFYNNNNQGKIKLFKYSALSVKAYQPKDVHLGFGTVLPYEDYTKIVTENDVTGYGIFITKQTQLKGKTIPQLYVEAKNPQVGDNSWINENSITNSCLRFAKNEALSVAQKTDETGIHAGSAADFVSWSYSFEIKQEDYKVRYSAVAYMIIDNTYCFFDQRDVSVCSLADAYLSLNIVSNADQLGCLQYFSNLEIEE